MSDKLDALLKTDDKTTVSLDSSKKYINTKRKINGICKALSKETKDYDPAKTVENIQNYLENKDKMERILYSEISSYVFAMDMNARGIFATNVEKLMIYALNAKSEEISDDCCKMIVKNQRIIAGNAQFTGIAAGRGVGFTTGLLLLGKGLGMRETPIRPHS